jgi:hypothetical protein
MDAGAIGSMVADYPLQLIPKGDERISSTLEFLMEHCFYRGGFFQDMVHSGINVYLTLALAQTLLRQGDERYRELIDTAARLSSPTGQWPEAVHPFSGGGCMGDGQHGWAAAEWVMILRNLFIREEGNGLVIGQGIFPRWLETEDDLSFGPTPTALGRIKITIHKTGNKHFLHTDCLWHDTPAEVELRIPGFKKETLTHLDHPHLLQPLK